MSKIHFIGIKGVGMAALAIYAKESGHQVKGSDSSEKFVTDELLERAGIEVGEFDSENLKWKPDFVVVSAAYGKDNVEYKAAKKDRLEIKTYSDVLAMFTRESNLIAVAGIHGKTTTTALVSYLLTKANLDPSYIIGSGMVPNLPSSGHAGKGEYFVSEADEYKKSPENNNSKFFDLTPKIEIITSIEMDHPDIFSNEEMVYQAFYRFACRIPRQGFITLCSDYAKAKKLYRSLVDRNIETYGFDENADWKIVDFVDQPGQTQFSLKSGDKIYGPFDIAIPGKANVLNSAAAIVTCLKIGLSERVLAKYIKEFVGVKRRFEVIGQKNGTVVIDDYAHHPRAIMMTLETAKEKYPDAKIWCIFQPHTFSRTKEMLPEFKKAFLAADKLIITEIFSSEREKEVTITGSDLAEAIRENQKNVQFIADKEKIISEIFDNLGKKDVILTVGAGDIYKTAEKIYEGLK